MPFLEVNGANLYYETFGEDRPGRRPIVLIHGSTPAQAARTGGTGARPANLTVVGLTVYNQITQGRGVVEMRKNAATSRRAINTGPRLIGRYIVTDPKVCHRQPTFRGTRIMVWQVLEQVGSGMAWETIVEEWEGHISKEAIAEAVQLASKAFLEHAHEYLLEPVAA